MSRNYQDFYGVVKRRPLFNEHTPLGDVPIEWLQNVEPKIVRKGFKGCWLSYAQADKNGKPMIWMHDKDGKRIRRYLSRYVMSIFYDFPKEYYVRRTCVFQQCVNPNHLFLSAHWKQD